MYNCTLSSLFYQTGLTVQFVMTNLHHSQTISLLILWQVTSFSISSVCVQTFTQTMACTKDCCYLSPVKNKYLNVFISHATGLTERTLTEQSREVGYSIQKLSKNSAAFQLWKGRGFFCPLTTKPNSVGLLEGSSIKAFFSIHCSPHSLIHSLNYF